VSIESYRNRLDNAVTYAEVWGIVKDTVKFALHRHRAGMLLFLDDLPIQLGAYHPLGTNNIVLNRVLIQIVEATGKPQKVINALIYNLLLHEYLHALGETSEATVRELVSGIAEKCFGKDHAAAQVALKSPWALLEGIPLDTVNVSGRVMEIVKDFEKTDRYIV